MMRMKGSEKDDREWKGSEKNNGGKKIMEEEK
jgi:hypothetical protein